MSRLRRLLPISLALALITTYAMQPSAYRGVRVHAASPPISTLVIFTPGIDPLQGSTPFNPYTRAQDSFSAAGLGQASMMDDLHFEATPPPDSPFAACAGGIAWLPYSYKGVAGGQVSPYTGAETGQALSTSAAAMQSVIAYA